VVLMAQNMTPFNSVKGVGVPLVDGVEGVEGSTSILWLRLGLVYFAPLVS